MMENDRFPVREIPTGVEIDVWICPRSSRNAVAGIHRGRVKIQIQSPPVDGAANRDVIRFLAKILEVTPSRVRCMRGASSRNKTFAVDDVQQSLAIAKLGLVGLDQ